MQEKIDYRDAHTAPSKGINYEKTFIVFKYRKYIWDWEKEILKKIFIKYFSDKTNIKYLDFACGTGRIISFLEKDISESIGVDISDSMISIAQANVKRSKIIKVDLTKTNIFNENYFDLITAFRFFLNAQPELREDVLNVLSKSLKDEGYFVFNIHLNKTSIYSRIIHLIRKINNLSFEINTMSIKQVSHMVEKAGLEIITTYHFAIIPIIKENTKIPILFIDPFEKFSSKIPCLRYFSRYLIFVCKKKH
jgi:ubiquinone/menaquinone biosynthesis C-methylase UbiE